MPLRDLVVFGASAGGVNALIDALSDGDPIDAAVLVALHLPADGRTMLPEILERKAHMPARVARHGDRLERGQILVAPPDRHLLVGSDSVRLSAGPRENRSRPAVDPLFRSAAGSHGPRAIAVVLSGMLADGAAGLVAIQRAGGYAIVQSPEDAIFPGMPSTALSLGGADDVVAARDIRPLLDRLTQEEVEGVEYGPDQPDIVEFDVEALKRAAESGTLTNLTCPECSGSLWEFEDGQVVSYRCRVGHAFTAEVLTEAQTDGIEDVLWKAVRAHEELASLLSKRAEHTGDGPEERLATMRENAKQALERAERLRRHIESVRAERLRNAGDQV
jgi:two-component system chemotaxis response regulator CheB